MGICEDSQDFGRRFAGIHETLVENLHGFVRIRKILGEDSQDFGRGFARIHKILREDSQEFKRLWERIHGDS